MPRLRLAFASFWHKKLRWEPLLPAISYFAVNSWLPRVTWALPSPLTVVSVISFSRILSSSNTTICILGLPFPRGAMHLRVNLIKSFMPSVVKLPPSRWSIISFEFRCVSTCINEYEELMFSTSSFTCVLAAILNYKACISENIISDKSSILENFTTSSLNHWNRVNPNKF